MKGPNILMKIDLPPNTKLINIQTPSLYFKKFPFKVEFEWPLSNSNGSNWTHRHSQYWERDAIIIKINKRARIINNTLTSKTRKGAGFHPSFFFMTEDDTQSFMDEMMIYIKKITAYSDIGELVITVNKMNDEQDATKVFRKQPYFGKYFYKLTVPAGNIDDVSMMENVLFNPEDLNIWDAAINKTTNAGLAHQANRAYKVLSCDTARITYGSAYTHTTIYTTDSDMMSICRLMVPSGGKLFKVVISKEI
jgi:hypothetical protein